MKIRALTGLLLLLAQSATVFGGDRSNVRAMGMARSFVASARGTDAIGVNPADLAIPGSSFFTLSLAPVGVRVSTDLLSYNIYQEYFTGVPGTNVDGKREPKYLNDADKSNILASIPDGVSTTRFDFEVMDVGATIATESFGCLGFAIVDRAGAKLTIPKDYARFYLFGLDSAGSQYSFDGTGISAWWWREYNFSYAYHIVMEPSTIRNLYAGIGVKLLRGYGLFETQRYSASIANRRVGSNQYLLDAQFDYLANRSGADFFDKDKGVNASPFPDPAGKGVGFDLGLSGQIRGGLLVAVSITDIGSIAWDKNIVQTDGQYRLTTDDPFSTSTTDSLQRAVKGTNRPGSSFSTPLPTVLRIGVSVVSHDFEPLRFLPDRLLLAFDYHQGLNSSMGNTTQPRLSLGIEYSGIPFLPLRTGISLGGGDHARWALGFGLDFDSACLDVATENFGMLITPRSFQMFSFAAGLKIRI